jgi:Family of unknown function (DUF5990)
MNRDANAIYAGFVVRAEQIEIRLRLVVEAPVSGVVYSLQNKRNQPVDAKRSTSPAPLVFEFPIRLGAGPSFTGEHVRREGPKRRFVYVAIGKQAGDTTSCWDRRMKIDIHTIAQPLLDKAVKGTVLEGAVAGAGRDGAPACATVALIRGWRASSEVCDQ